MNNKKKKLPPQITSEMTVLDVVSAHQKTLPVFKEYDAVAGECICCKSLFETLGRVALKYDFDLNNFLENLQSAID